MSKDYYKLENIHFHMVQDDSELRAISKALTADLHGRLRVIETPIEFNNDWASVKIYDILVVTNGKAFIHDEYGWTDGFTYYIASVYYDMLVKEVRKYGTSYYVLQVS